MPTLNYQDIYIDCDKAIKGEDYIHLLDETGMLIARFDGIVDFSGFTLENGSYTDPTDDHDCYIAVIRDDGTIGKGGHKCSDIGKNDGLVIKSLGEGLTLDEFGELSVTVSIDYEDLDEVSF